MTQVTIELPDQVARDLEAYLQANSQESLAELIHEVLQVKLPSTLPSKAMQGNDSSLVDFFRNSPLQAVAGEIDLNRDDRAADERITL